MGNRSGFFFYSIACTVRPVLTRVYRIISDRTDIIVFCVRIVRYTRIGGRLPLKTASPQSSVKHLPRRKTSNDFHRKSSARTNYGQTNRPVCIRAAQRPSVFPPYTRSRSITFRLCVFIIFTSRVFFDRLQSRPARRHLTHIAFTDSGRKTVKLLFLRFL